VASRRGPTVRAQDASRARQFANAGAHWAPLFYGRSASVSLIVVVLVVMIVAVLWVVVVVVVTVVDIDDLAMIVPRARPEAAGRER